MLHPENPQLKLAHDFVQFTGSNIFLTGKAGTGKTTFLRSIKSNSPKRMIVTAPTGVAAINAAGVTLHSFFQLAFGPQLPKAAYVAGQTAIPSAINRFSKEKINIIRSLDLLVIDEISMVRADLLDAVDEVLRRYKNRYKPFGGVQLLMIGDLQQLAPVVKDHEWELLKPYYDTPFFFSSIALGKTNFVSIELKHIYRQSDIQFIGLLNKIRENRLDKEAIDMLNNRFIPDFDSENNKGYITLTTHNHQAHLINGHQLDRLKEKRYSFEAEVSGVFPEYSYPTDSTLILKIGAQVMFVKNDASYEKRFFNGKIGAIKRIEDGIVYVACPGEEEEIDIAQVEWNNYSYSIDDKTNEIVENVIGTFKQVPLKLAWAITIHKSQGLTFDKAIIDANAAFAHGQVYVALSRCRTLEGIVLTSRIESRSIKSDGSVLGFMREVENNPTDEQQLGASRQAFERSLLIELNDFSTIQRRLDYCAKLVRENETILEGKPLEYYKEASAAFYTDILEVSGKFVSQINRLLQENADIESNMPLKDRLSKACTYYHEKFNLIFTRFFKKFVIETDNKAVRKSLKEALGKLSDDVVQKNACLEAGKADFTIRSYMEVRAKSAIDKKTVQASQSSQSSNFKEQPTKEYVSDEILHPALYLLIKNWRNQKAKELNLPVYMILPQKTMMELTAKLPETLSQLKKVKGFGEKKVQTVGPELLLIIADFCKENKLKESQLSF